MYKYVFFTELPDNENGCQRNQYIAKNMMQDACSCNTMN